MKTNGELRQAAKLQAENIANEITNGGGVTLASLWRLVAAARVLTGCLLKLQARAQGQPEPKTGE